MELRTEFVLKGNWTDLYKPTLEKYNNPIHSSTGAKPVEAHKDENRVNVKVNLTRKQKHFRKYPQLSVGDKVKNLHERSW